MTPGIKVGGYEIIALIGKTLGEGLSLHSKSIGSVDE
jgi:hypothetical protein